MPYKIPSFADLGDQAQVKGDFRSARKYFRTALQNLEDSNLAGQQLQAIELMTAISDCYLGEGHLVQAAAWCYRAGRRAEIFFGANSLKLACLLAKQAQLNILQAEVAEFEDSYEGIKRIYLLSPDAGVAALIAPLSDLVVTLCSQHHLSRAAEVNDFVNQIEKLNAEDRLQGTTRLAG